MCYRIARHGTRYVRTPAFAAQAHKQSVLVAEADADGDEQDLVEAVAAPWGDEACFAARSGLWRVVCMRPSTAWPLRGVTCNIGPWQ
ncbi:MAG: hypothetical protein CME34_00830 [Gordonia sp.]|nr:hypothetical protein [Gordonia sp. (in: high G+C Gram-positive bacteria)]MDY6809190.1 antitoxin MazE-like protein [Actinomycetota bacterium]